MDILNFISWIKGRRQVTSVDPARTLLPVGLKDGRRDDEYLAGAISVQDFINQVGTGSQGPQGPQGIEGPQGTQGIQGFQGSQGNPGLNGSIGPVGPAGLNWQGAWSALSSYALDDAVGYAGASWFCINPTAPSLTPPNTDTVNWALLASQGAVGPQGLTGTTGAQGIQGVQGIQGIQGIQGLQGIQGTSAPYFYLSGEFTVTSTSDTFFSSILIPANTYTGVQAITLTAQFVKTTGYTTASKVSINTSNTLVGAAELGNFNLASTARFANMARTFYMDLTNLYVFPLVSAVSDNITVTSSGQTVPVNWTVDQYIIFSGSVSSAGQVLRLRGAKIH
jgi:hypothetical protein